MSESFVSVASMGKGENRLEIGYTMGHIKLSAKLMVKDDHFEADSLHTCAKRLYLVIYLQPQSSLFQSASNA